MDNSEPLPAENYIFVFEDVFEFQSATGATLSERLIEAMQYNYEIHTTSHRMTNRQWAR